MVMVAVASMATPPPLHLHSTASSLSTRLHHLTTALPPAPISSSLSANHFHPDKRSHGAFRCVSALSEASERMEAGRFGDLASVLEGVEVVDLNGRTIPILDLWSNRKAIVGFARHFGCVFCRKRADILSSKKDVMDAAGVTLVIIGPGSVDQAKAFSAQTKFKGELYADPSHSSFDALGFVSGVSTTFTPMAGVKIGQLYMEGYRQDWGLSFQKDTVSRGGWQQGGILVAGPGKSNILYLHKDKEAGDDPDIEEVLKVCCS